MGCDHKHSQRLDWEGFPQEVGYALVHIGLEGVL